jgi:drug/metabolite transporter (DMT)-like permease
MNKTHNSMLALHSAVFILGMTALFSRFIELSALDITLIRSVFACLSIALFIIYLKESLLLSTRRDYLIASILGILLAAHWVSFFHAMQISSVAVGVIALYTYPVITVFLEPLFHGEKPHIADILSAVTVFLGIYLMAPTFNLDDQITQGIAWGVLSALLFALRNIIQGHYFSHHPARLALFYQSLIVVLVLLPFAGGHLNNISDWQWVQLLILGIFFTALPHTLLAHSLRHLKAKTAGLIGCLQVVYATVFAAILLDSFPGISIIMGGMLVVSAAMYESFFNKK